MVWGRVSILVGLACLAAVAFFVVEFPLVFSLGVVIKQPFLWIARSGKILTH